MHILIFGATGFIGKSLVKQLNAKGYKIQVVSRNYQNAKRIFLDQVQIIEWDYSDINRLTDIINEVDVIINLAGANIAGNLWTSKYREKIINSRIGLSTQISKAVEMSKKKPKQIIQSSAIGYYGANQYNVCNENCKRGTGFLSDVCEKWENALVINDSETKKVIVRTGVVLGKEGGMLPKLILPIKYFLGSNFGKGDNKVSWIHIKDIVQAIGFIIENNQEGVFNFTAPKPVNSKTINLLISKKLKRPVWFRIPKFILKLFLGEMARELLLANQNVVPSKLKQIGYKFLFPEIEDAIQDILKKQD